MINFKQKKLITAISFALVSGAAFAQTNDGSDLLNDELLSKVELKNQSNGDPNSNGDYMQFHKWDKDNPDSNTTDVNSNSYTPTDKDGNAIYSNNVVIVNDVEPVDDNQAFIVGGQGNDTVKNTHVILNGGKFDTVVGAYISRGFKDITEDPLFTEGSVYVNDGDFEEVFGSYIHVASNLGEPCMQPETCDITAQSTESRGKVYVNGGKAAIVVGANIASTFGKSVAHGEVYITGGNVNTLIGGVSSVNYYGVADATGKVFIAGGDVSGMIGGASSAVSFASEDQQYNESMTSKGEVNISGGSIDGTVIGASVLSTGTTLQARAAGNVSITGNVEFTENSTVFGSSYDGSKSNNYNIFDGNTFSMGSNALKLQSMGNFENYNFYINDYNKNSVINGEALVTITDSIKNDNTVFGDDITKNKSTASIKNISGEGIVKAGDKITLIDAEGASFQLGDKEHEGLGSIFNKHDDNTVNVGLIKSANIRYELDGDKYIAHIDEVYTDMDVVHARVKPLAEGRLAGLMNVVGGSDVLLGVLETTQKAQGTWTPIAIMDGGRNRYKSGSHIKANDYNILLGTSYQATDALSVGAAIEYGRSDYKTYNGNIHGKGHSSNYGVSLFGQYAKEMGVGQTAYTDFSLRFGNTRTKFNSDDIIVGNGQTAHYSSKAKYYGGHIGAGYIFDLDDKVSVDTSARYLYAHLGSDSVVIDGDRVSFQSSKSSRIQLKAKLNYATTETTTVYAAATYEYEFDGKAKTNVSGISIDAPSVKGSTGILEFGVKTMPLATSKNLSLDFNIKGYAGKRDGARASAIFKYDL